MQEELLEQIATAVAELASWRERLRTAAYTMLAYLAEDERRAHVAVVDAYDGGERLQREIHKFFLYAFELIDQGRAESGPGRRPLSRATAEAISGAISLQIRSGFGPGWIEEARARVPELMYAAVLPYLGQEAAAEELRIPPPEIGPAAKHPTPFRNAT
jgi:hypothetical protein